ncbi:MULTISPECIES: glycosyltransferase [unclassified Robiginitalea]|uniref:glycosyltransferase n=1 Tax=Robiginitalea TaxID=252306 RepID=UPI00234B1A40|nr:MULTISPECIES: glycosyltransferase [unclassified Robiginitalea]MDC6353813.1 glycosyltransferase [Robiginitalea sp. PM2]MDC6374080.1 glycosyltransferase [Robiginitalea sp. SP8]
MRLSILIPLYNKEQYIDRCMDSLLAQGLAPGDFEVILVDDGSKDASAAIAGRYAAEHGNVRLISQENAGPSAARNRALEAAGGDYVYFLDADDLLAGHVAGRLLDICEENNLDILEFNSRDIENHLVADADLEGSPDGTESVTPVADGLTFISRYYFRNQAWRYFIKRAYLLESGIRFPEDMRAYEDLIFTASIILHSNRMARVELDAHRYVIVPGSIVTSKDPEINLGFIQGMVKAVGELNRLIRGLDNSHKAYAGVVKKMRTKQQSIVFALCLRVFKYRLHNRRDLKKILDQLSAFKAYPMDRKIREIDNGNAFHSRIMVPIFNNRTLLFLGAGIMRLVPRT